MKKIISLLLVVIMAMSMSVMVFAEEADVDSQENGIVENSIDVEVPPESSVTLASFGTAGDANTDMWASGTYSLDNGDILYTLLFTIPDRYFAYETYATGAPTGYYSVTLVRNVTSSYASISNLANGVSVKNDWISVTPNYQYQFKIYNYSGSTISVHITYYSWA